VYSVLLKISKLIFTAVAFAHIAVVAEAFQKDSAKDVAITSMQHSYAVTLQQAVQHIPNTYYEYVIRNFAMKLGQTLGSHAIQTMPDEDVVKNIQKICWCASVGDLSLLHADQSELHNKYEKVVIVNSPICEHLRGKFYLLRSVNEIQHILMEKKLNTIKTYCNFMLFLGNSTANEKPYTKINLFKSNLYTSLVISKICLITKTPLPS